MKFHFHDWQDIECTNSGEGFQRYVGELYKSKLIEDFKGLLTEREMVFPKHYTGGRISYFNSYSEACNISNFIYYEDYKYQLIEPAVRICMKCMKYKVKGLHKSRLKEVYVEYFKKNMVIFISKSKKLKLTVDGVKDETYENAGKLDTLTVFLKQMNAIHERENEVLKLIKLI